MNIIKKILGVIWLFIGLVLLIMLTKEQPLNIENFLSTAKYGIGVLIFVALVISWSFIGHWLIFGDDDYSDDQML